MLKIIIQICLHLQVNKISLAVLEKKYVKTLEEKKTEEDEEGEEKEVVEPQTTFQFI